MGKSKVTPTPEKSERILTLGEKTIKFVYDSLTVLSHLKLIPFRVVRDDEKKGRTGSTQPLHKMSPTDRQEVKEGHVPRKFERFTKSWDNWQYYIMSGFYMYGNIRQTYYFFEPVWKTGHLKMDIFFAGDMYFAAAMAFSMTFKTALAFSEYDLLCLLNNIDHFVVRMKKDEDEGAEKKYCWYATPVGIVGIWWTAFTGHAAWGVIIAVALYRCVERSDIWGWGRIGVELFVGILVGFMDCFLSITSVYLIALIIIHLKINLLKFEELDKFEEENEATVRIWPKLRYWIRRYKRLVVFASYGNGYFRVLFPPYIGVVQFIVLALLYVALTGHRYLPLYIYWTYPAGAAFVFAVLVCLLLSQVGNIFRQSQQVCCQLSRQLGVEYTLLTSGNGRDNLRARQQQQQSLGEDQFTDDRFGMMVQKQQPAEEYMNDVMERRCLKRQMMTVRRLGFYSSFYGAIDQNTPATMTANCCNCMILLLSFH